jgi:hypothetical protein
LEFSFAEKMYYFSGDTKNETEAWMNEIAQAGGIKRKMVNFEKKNIVFFIFFLISFFRMWRINFSLSTIRKMRFLLIM